MKVFLRIAAGLSFLFFFIGGSLVLSITFDSPASDALPIMALGFVFVGTAFFVGPILLAVAEKFSPPNRRA